MARKTFAFFPEAAFGPALNSVGIAQAVERMGHKAVFLSDPGFVDVYKGYGFEAHPVNLSAPMPPEQMAKFWEDFINGHIPNFRKAPIDQIDNYVKECWEAIVDSAKWAQKDLPAILAAIRPDDASENEIDIAPPHLLAWNPVQAVAIAVTDSSSTAVLVDKDTTIGTLTELRANPHPWIQAYFAGPRGRAAAGGES